MMGVRWSTCPSSIGPWKFRGRIVTARVAIQPLRSVPLAMRMSSRTHSSRLSSSVDRATQPTGRVLSALDRGWYATGRVLSALDRGWYATGARLVRSGSQFGGDGTRVVGSGSRLVSDGARLVRSGSRFASDGTRPVRSTIGDAGRKFLPVCLVRGLLGCESRSEAMTNH